MRYFIFLLLLGQVYAAELSQFYMRPAKVEDIDTLYELVCDLAVFEGKDLATLPVNKENLKKYGFGETPYFHVEFAENQNGSFSVVVDARTAPKSSDSQLSCIIADSRSPCSRCPLLLQSEYEGL